MIQDPVVEGLEPDAYVLSIHIASCSLSTWPSHAACFLLNCARDARYPVKDQQEPRDLGSFSSSARSSAKRSRPARSDREGLRPIPTPASPDTRGATASCEVVSRTASTSTYARDTAGSTEAALI